MPGTGAAAAASVSLSFLARALRFRAEPSAAAGSPLDSTEATATAGTLVGSPFNLR